MIVVNYGRELLYLLVMVMDVCWLAPLVAVVSGLLGHGPIPALVLLALYVAAFWSGRLLSRLALDPVRTRILSIYLAATAILIAEKALHYAAYSWLDAGWLLRLASDLIQMARATPPAALTLVCGVGLWYAGLRLSAGQSARAIVPLHFSAGLAIFAFVLVLAAMRGLPDPTAGIFAFFFCGLMAIALARLHDLPAGQAPAAGRYWLTILLAAIAVVLVVSAILVVVLSAIGGAGESALSALSGLSRLLGQALLLILTPFGYLVAWLIAVLEWLNGGVRRSADPNFSAPAQPLDRADTAPTQIPFIIEQILRVAPLVLFLALAAWLITRALSRKRELSEDAASEYRESIGGLGSLWGDVTGFLGGLWARLSGQARERIDSLTAVSAPEGGGLSVRQLYGRLLRLAAGLGAPRRPDQTPLEFLPELKRALPAAGSDPDDLTAAYLHARYALRPPTDEEVQAARAAWDRIRRSPTAARS